jgi:poly-gamma-glutamate synthesis protein (capsule biosynthesis protein)
MFARVKPILENADLAICHLEVPLSPTNDDLSSYPLFSAPHELADALADAGYDGCSTASNHSYDRGAEGVVDTVDILEQAGLAAAGMARRPEEAWSAVTYEVGDLSVAQISATYWLNGLAMPENQQWLVQLLDVDELLAIAARAKQAGADLVVLSLHCCTEYLHEPTAPQREQYEALIRAPYVDLIVGSHSHVVGPIAAIDGEYVIYGLGNFLSAQSQPVTLTDGVIAMVEVEGSGDSWEVTSVSVIPTWVEPGTYRILPSVEWNMDSYRRTLAYSNMYGGQIGPYLWRGQPGWRLPES